MSKGIVAKRSRAATVLPMKWLLERATAKPERNEWPSWEVDTFDPPWCHQPLPVLIEQSCLSGGNRHPSTHCSPEAAR